MEHQKNLRWVVIASVVIGLIIGLYQAESFTCDGKKIMKSKITCNRHEFLNASGDYEGAWQKLEQALVIRPYWQR